MKKTTFKSVALMAAVALMGTMFVNCGGGASGNSVVDDAISQAEQTITLVETPIFGTLPSLLQQKLEAGTIVGKYFRELKTDDMDAAIKNKQLRDEAEESLSAIYKQKISEAANALDGKDVKVEFDENQISAATATLKVSEADRGFFNFVFNVTMANPVNKEVLFKWVFMDAEGNELQTSSDYLTPGEKMTKEYMVIPSDDYCQKFDHLYLKFE